MHSRKIKKHVAGQWQLIKWNEVKKGDLLRIYDRGMKVSDGTDVEFRATSNAYPVEIDGNTYWQFNYEPYERPANSKSTKDVRQGE